MLCDCILTNEKLTYQNADFWIESFSLVRRVIGGVDYKGVREIMKVRTYSIYRIGKIFFYLLFDIYLLFSFLVLQRKSTHTACQIKL